MEIVEVSESESLDTDTEEKEQTSAHVDTPRPQKAPVSILKISSPESTQKDLADLLDEALEQSPTTFLKKAKLPMATSTPEITTTRIDTESVAEYLILDEGETSVKRKEVTFASPVPKRIQQVKEDCDSFYGSDKETDEPLIFSDDTEIEVGSSSSEESEANGNKGGLDKVVGYAYVKGGNFFRRGTFL